MSPKLFFSALIIIISICRPNISLAAPPNNAPSDTPAEFLHQCAYSPGDTILSIPPHITSIPDYACAHNTQIRHIRFPDNSNIHSIGNFAFWDCPSLISINIPYSLSSLGEAAFQECSSLTTIHLPKSLDYIPDYCFAWCRRLKNINFQNIADIRRLSFAYCESLESPTFSSSLAHIGPCAFTHCNQITSLYLPDSINELESYAFSECTSLSEVRLPSNSNMLGELIFSGCRALKKIEIISPTPPYFDCNSSLFEPDETEILLKCKLYIPPDTLEKYSSTYPWNSFHNIIPSLP